MDTAVALILVLLSIAIGVILALKFAAWRAGRRGAWGGGVDRVVTQHITERVRSVGRLVALEVCAKEIATATRGIADGWVPPLLLSPARVAMIFQFRKQYFVDLASIGGDDVRELPTMHDDRRRRLGLAPLRRVRITLPALESDLALSGVTPYDIQAGRVLGLVDIIPMNADRQAELMLKAQSHAAQVFDDQDEAYRAQAADAVEVQLRSLLGLMGVEVEVAWRAETARHGVPGHLEAAAA
ncbi:MAG: DUF4230 domain-containing protein [Phycisphaeraceae bacterium]|nr:DUF4230 domain-containing protein [Phycisphaeraceae bacterium]